MNCPNCGKLHECLSALERDYHECRNPECRCVFDITGRIYKVGKTTPTYHDTAESGDTYDKEQKSSGWGKE